MSLATGTRIGTYEVLSPLGHGGMGEVYRARDRQLNRNVALKVLPALFSADPDRLARFRREAETLATLNHPNIGQIYGIESWGQSPALVLELVEGPTLADRMAAGRMPVDEALHVARQIADAIEAAHERGIVHRDLKPANVKLRDDGVVKVLDFGLAKALAPDRSNPFVTAIAESPTVSAHATQLGVVLGTAAYMSPEQAMGKAVDRRVDIWALGVVLFEMLAGRRLFDGETVSEVLAAVIKEEPSFEALSADVPPSIRHLLVRCLRKDPRLRLQAIGDVRLLIEEALRPELLPEAIGNAPMASSSAKLRTGVPWALAGALAVTAGWLVLSRPQAVPQVEVPLELTSIVLPAENPVRPTLGQAIGACADVSSLVYRAKVGDGTAIFLKRPGQLSGAPIPGTDGAAHPFCSPNGEQVGFFLDRRLWTVDATGGQPVPRANVVSPRGATWFGDTIVFAGTATGLFRMAADGSDRKPLTRLDESRRERTHRFPSFVPGGRAVLFTVQEIGIEDYYEDARIDAVWLETEERVTVYDGGASMAVAVESGHLVYAREGTLFAAPLDLETLQLTGEGAPVRPDVAGEPSSGAVHFALTTTGTLYYVPGDLRRRILMRFDRSGATSELPTPEDSYNEVSLTRDGTRVAMARVSGRGYDICTYDLPGGPLRTVTSGGINRSPRWFPDNSHLAYVTLGADGSTTIYRRGTDGSEPVEIRTFAPGTQAYLDDVSPDGAWLAIRTQEGRRGPFSLSVISTTGEGPMRLSAGPLTGRYATFSPNGQWLAFDAPSGGGRQILFVKLDESGETVSGPVGQFPRWSDSELFF
ncbi:MAG TPA: protein kinase, partial [Vicinamibacterales bacterium]|nr:protein kinase [Vicinamibacterales bacterium]